MVRIPRHDCFVFVAKTCNFLQKQIHHFIVQQSDKKWREQPSANKTHLHDDVRQVGRKLTHTIRKLRDCDEEEKHEQILLERGLACCCHLVHRVSGQMASTVFMSLAVGTLQERAASGVENNPL